jgi:hypothetical protein
MECDPDGRSLNPSQTSFPTRVPYYLVLKVVRRQKRRGKKGKKLPSSIRNSGGRVQTLKQAANANNESITTRLHPCDKRHTPPPTRVQQACSSPQLPAPPSVNDGGLFENGVADVFYRE